jgi:hypothetical protein
MGAVSLFQNTLTWTRPPEDLPHCGSILMSPPFTSRGFQSRNILDPRLFGA